MSDFIIMRQNMVKGQVAPENVIHPLLLQALSTIPRERFVPRQLVRMAYTDADFPLGKERFLLRPATLARLLEALDPKPTDRVLYIGGGTGYGPALLGRLVKHITALDEDETLTQQAERRVNELALSDVMQVVLGPLDEGWEANAPYHKILIEGGVETIPQNLISQLKDAGRLVTIKYQPGKQSVALKIDKKQKITTENYLFDAFAPRLKAFQAQKTFVF
jgi:protein-L-isoaspartate(D-aspartate) O-methyltransferase